MPLGSLVVSVYEKGNEPTVGPLAGVVERLRSLWSALTRAHAPE